MARVNPDGTISGKAGNIVYFTRNGVTFMKEFKKPKDNKRPRQLIQRAKVSAASSFLAGFRKIINIGYQGSDTYKMDYMEGLYYHIKNALADITPEGSEQPLFQVVPDKVKVARGFIEPPQIDVCERAGNKISLNWNPKLGAETNRFYDSLAIVSWHEGENAYADFHVGRRDDGGGTTTLSVHIPGPVHLWAFYVNQDKNQLKTKANVSDSVYLGEF